MASETKRSPERLTDAGIILLEQEKREEAIKCFNEAIDLDPKYAAAYWNRGEAYR
ncbi:MAG: tetratricopeptide repeat protein [Chloroflexi bacterium]|nr:tetratricopeptide repeat protein [Chloroflexota bacterium]